MPFLGNMRVEKVNAWEWRLLKPLTYYGRRDKYEIPAGFITDYASIPQVFWCIVSPINLSAEPSVLHDYCYDSHIVSRAEADGLFRRTLREAGVGFVRRWIMYLFVRMFGHFSWGPDAPKPVPAPGP